MPVNPDQAYLRQVKAEYEKSPIAPAYEGEILDSDVIYEELFWIWRNRVKTKHYTFEAYEFERNAGVYLSDSAKRLASCEWSPSKTHDFWIHNPDRLIHAHSYVDRIVEAWITEKYIKSYVAPKVLEENMACQKGKGTDKLITLVKQKLTELYREYGYDFYFFQYDIEGYYDNLSHDMIKQQFSGLNETGRCLINNVIDSYHSDNEESYAFCTDPLHWYGIPKGTLPSQWVGMLYLNELDHLLLRAPNCLGGARYVDDSISFYKTKEDCRNAQRMAERYLAENQMGIRLHPRKTNYAPMNRGFNLCGWHYEIKPSGKILMHIKQSKKKEMKSDLRHLQKQYARGEISIVEVNDAFRGRMNHLEKGDTYHLRKYLCRQFPFQRDSELCAKKYPEIFG